MGSDDSESEEQEERRERRGEKREREERTEKDDRDRRRDRDRDRDRDGDRDRDRDRDHDRSGQAAGALRNFTGAMAASVASARGERPQGAAAGAAGEAPAKGRGKQAILPPPRKMLDRSRTCPFLLRIFRKIGEHHGIQAFAERGKEPVHDELQVYAWPDVTLRELADLIKDVAPEARDPKVKLAFNLIYPDKTGKNVSTSLGTVTCARRGPDDDKAQVNGGVPALHWDDAPYEVNAPSCYDEEVKARPATFSGRSCPRRLRQCMHIGWRVLAGLFVAGAVRPSSENSELVRQAGGAGHLEEKTWKDAKTAPDQMRTNRWQERKKEVKSVARFWTLLGSVGVAGYAVSFLLKRDERSPDASRLLKVVALKLHKDKIFMQLFCTAGLFGLADLLAQRVRSYHEKSNLQDGYKIGGWDWRYTLAIMACACLFQVAILGRFYDYCDARFGVATTWQAALLKAVKMQTAFTFGYLPLGVFLYALLICFLFESFADSTDNCGPSAIAGLPFNFGSSVVQAVELWPGDYLQAMVFWPPSHAVNYVLIQRWSPNFRPIFDGVVVLFWNTFVLGGGADREAVGPTLFGPAPGPKAKVPSSVDCSKHSFAEMGRWIAQKLGELAESTKRGLIRCWETLSWALQNGWKWFKHLVNLTRQRVCASVVFLVTFLRWLLVAVLYYLGYCVMVVLTIARVSLYWTFAIIKGSVMLVLAILDFLKNCMFMWFIPDVSSIGKGCFYCVFWPKKGQWPKEVCGPAPAFADWVPPFCPHCY
ncbi:unnamed protein product [Symbiodinium pilosum]|uniref:Histone deacetylase complex subunit SAP18 n=1 Tax=Symbiodinium pilosum TaxID=2952 RepID=A0A812TMP8_SYMPI|nr:unnamed protein product [Symbiodinium pilosum]